MGGRTTVYNRGLVTDEKWEAVREENKTFLEEFMKYLAASDKSPQTMYQYRKQLEIFFVWNSEFNRNKNFVDIKKRDFINFFGYLMNELNASSNRVGSIKAVLSSLSNFIERVMDDEYPDFKNLIKSLEPVAKTPVREKTILSNEQIDECLDKLVEQGKYQIACALALFASSGMRKAEIIQMKVEYFTEDNVVLGCMYSTEKVRTKGRGKQGKRVPRYVFKGSFDKYLNLWLAEREKLGIKSEWLFVTYRNGNYKQAQITTINSWSEKISKLLNVEFYPHCTRHYWCTKAKRDGYPDSVIQKLQNWSSMEMVSVYNDMGDMEELEEFFKKRETKGE